MLRICVIVGLLTLSLASVTVPAAAAPLLPGENALISIPSGFGSVFVRDRCAAIPTTELVSRGSGPAGVAANDRSSGGAISSDGTLVAFRSSATNLTTRRYAAHAGRDGPEAAAPLTASCAGPPGAPRRHG